MFNDRMLNAECSILNFLLLNYLGTFVLLRSITPYIVPGWTRRCKIIKAKRADQSWIVDKILHRKVCGAYVSIPWWLFSDNRYPAGCMIVHKKKTRALDLFLLLILFWKLSVFFSPRYNIWKCRGRTKRSHLLRFLLLLIRQKEHLENRRRNKGWLVHRWYYRQ